MSRIAVTPIRLEYTYSPGIGTSEFLTAIVEGKLLGRRCPECGKVYVPGRLGCPRCGVHMNEVVEVRDTGVVTSFCIVNIPFAGQAVECPYVSASVQLDGSDSSIFHLVQEVDAYAVTPGMRVQAVWAPREERTPSLDAIRYFKPLEPGDA